MGTLVRGDGYDAVIRGRACKWFMWGAPKEYEAPAGNPLEGPEEDEDGEPARKKRRVNGCYAEKYM
jgi:hypothetical protein